MTFTKLRITLDTDPSGNVTRPKVYLLLKNLIRDKNLTTHTCGIESLNGYGEPVPTHFHFHFIFPNPDLIDPKRALREYLKKKAIALGFTLSGTKRWAVQLVDEPEDWNRFFRYPLKIYPFLPLCCPPPNDDDGEWLETNILLARDEQERRVAANIIAREKQREKSTLKDKLFLHLENLVVLNNGLQPDHQFIWCAILDYYKSIGKPINFQTINGYTLLFQLEIGTITPEQAYCMRSNAQ